MFAVDENGGLRQYIQLNSKCLHVVPGIILKLCIVFYIIQSQTLLCARIIYVTRNYHVVCCLLTSQ